MRRPFISSLFALAALGASAGAPAQEPGGAGAPLPAVGLPAYTLHEDAWRGETGVAADAPAPYRFSSEVRRGALQFGRAAGASASSASGPMLHVETVAPTPGALMNQRPSHRFEVYRFGPDSSILLAGKKRGVQVLLRVYSH